MWFLMLLAFAVESLAVSLGVVAFNLSANVVSAAVVATVTIRFFKLVMLMFFYNSL